MRELQAPATPERLCLALELLARYAGYLPPTALLLPERRIVQVPSRRVYSEPKS